LRERGDAAQDIAAIGDYLGRYGATLPGAG